MSKTLEARVPLWKRILLSPILLEKSQAQKLAYVGVMTALCIISNFFEIKLADSQISLTIFTSMLTGILLGPLFGMVAAFFGDALAFFANPGGFIYMPWIGISVAMMALIAGLAMKLPLHFRGSCYLKIALACIACLLVCSIGINTTGMYFFYTKTGFSSKALNIIAERFGGVNMYWTYALARLVFMGQLINNVANYALLFMIIPLLKVIKPLKLEI